MEFECKRLEQCLETLKRDKKLKSWTEHNNESGYTVITIRCISKVIPKVSDSKATREATKCSDQNSTPVSEASLSDMNTRVNVPPSSQSHQNNTRDNSTPPISSNTTSLASTPITEPNSNSNSRKVFKPVSQYQLKRDADRREAFRVRCTTRSRTNELTDSSDISKTLDKSVELQRDTGQNVSLLSNACISPIIPTESPWADGNPYSYLDVDTDVKSTSSDSSDELYGATGEVLPEPGLASVSPQFRSIAILMAEARENIEQLAKETKEVSKLARNSVT